MGNILDKLMEMGEAVDKGTVKEYALKKLAEDPAIHVAQPMTDECSHPECDVTNPDEHYYFNAAGEVPEGVTVSESMNTEDGFMLKRQECCGLHCAAHLQQLRAIDLTSILLMGKMVEAGGEVVVTNDGMEIKGLLENGYKNGGDLLDRMIGRPRKDVVES